MKKGGWQYAHTFMKSRAAAAVVCVCRWLTEGSSAKKISVNI